MTPFVNDWPFKPIPARDRGRRESKLVMSEGEDENESKDMDSYDEKHISDDDVDVWKPLWSDCAVGKFAILRCEIGTPSKFGVCVVKYECKFNDKYWICKYSNIELFVQLIKLFNQNRYVNCTFDIFFICILSARFNLHVYIMFRVLSIFINT